LQVTIVAKDGGQPYARQSSCILKVTVTDINDNTPFFKNPSVDNYTVYASILSDEIITRIEVLNNISKICRFCSFVCSNEALS